MTQLKSIAGIPNAKLQLTNGCELDFDLLARFLNAICSDERLRIPQADLGLVTGLAPRRVEHLGSIANALGLANKGTYRPTPLGRLIQRRDPFCDDLGGLWFLHYRISSDPRHLVWNRMVTQVLLSQQRLTREQARLAFDDLRLYLTPYSLQKHVRDELKVFFDAYTEQRFRKLAYLRADGKSYVLSYREPLPPLVLAASIVCFRDRHRPGDTSVPVADLLTDRNGPGVVFQMDEGLLRATLESLKLQPGLSLESRADLDQVRLTDNTPDYAWMERYYAQR